jgi:hypothetical protein
MGSSMSPSRRIESSRNAVVRLRDYFAAVRESARVKVCGCRPHDGGAAYTGAGVRKPPMEML